jgi:predicted DNA-binding protein
MPRLIRRSISMTPDMRDRLALLASRQKRTISEADLIREAIRRYLDEQEDLSGSRRYFQKTFKDRIEQLESALSFHLNILVYLLAALHPIDSPERIAEAIIAARRDGDTLLKQIQAVRELK